MRLRLLQPLLHLSPSRPWPGEGVLDLHDLGTFRDAVISEGGRDESLEVFRCHGRLLVALDCASYARRKWRVAASRARSITSSRGVPNAEPGPVGEGVDQLAALYGPGELKAEYVDVVQVELPQQGQRPSQTKCPKRRPGDAGALMPRLNSAALEQSLRRSARIASLGKWKLLGHCRRLSRRGRLPGATTQLRGLFPPRVCERSCSKRRRRATSLHCRPTLSGKWGSKRDESPCQRRQAIRDDCMGGKADACIPFARGCWTPPFGSLAMHANTYHKLPA